MLETFKNLRLLTTWFLISDLISDIVSEKMSNIFSEFSRCSVIPGPQGRNPGRSESSQVAQMVKFQKLCFWGGFPGRSEGRYSELLDFFVFLYLRFSEISEFSKFSVILRPLGRNPGRSEGSRVAQMVDLLTFRNIPCLRGHPGRSEGRCFNFP